MAGPTYATDLSDVILDMSSTTGWTALGGGQAGLTAPEADYFIQGSNCISKTAWTNAIKGMIYDFGSGITVPTDGAVVFWLYYSATNSLATQAAGGLQAIIGSSSSAYNHWYVSGKDRLTFDVWRPYAVDPTFTVDTTTGSPSGTLQFFGGLANLPTSAGPTKGAPLGVDAIRYGRCTLSAIDGDGTSGYAAFDTAETYANDVTRRWGLLEKINGSYFMQGFLSLGLSGTAVDFRDSNRVIFIRDTLRSSVNFNRIEVINSGSNVLWTNIAIFSLGTRSPGTFVTTAGTVTLDTCQFTDMGTFTFLASSSVTDTTFRRCKAVTAPGSSLLNSNILSSTVAADASALVWNVATDTDGKLDGMSFSKGTNAHHALALGTSSPTNVTLNNIAFSGFNATDAQNDSTIHVLRTSGAVTINLVGCTGNISYKSAGASPVTFVIDPVTVTITVKDVVSGSPIENARVIVKASDGAGPLPYQDSVSITRSGSTATVTHAAHGLANGHKVLIKGCAEVEYNGVKTITVNTASEYTYTVSGTPDTPATGAPISTGLVLEGLTNASGIISDTRSYSGAQNIVGYARKSTASPFYKTGPISGQVSASSGFGATVQMIPDE